MPGVWMASLSSAPIATISSSSTRVPGLVGAADVTDAVRGSDVLEPGGNADVEGPVNTNLGSATGMQVFAGLRGDPFFIDLEQFFRIIPDRRPVSGPLSQLPPTPSANSFRSAGQALDYVRGFNDMAIVIELPVSMIERDPQHPSPFGVWGTTSRARSN